MAELNFSLLEHLPEGVIALENDIVTAVNPRAKALIPALQAGQALTELPFPAVGSSGTGTFYYSGKSFRFSASREGNTRLFFFSPVPEQAPGTPEYFLPYLRQCAAPFMMYLAQRQEDPLAGSAGKSLHCLMRLISNMDLLDRVTALVDPVPVDLVSLCRTLAMEAGGLLKEIHRTLRFECSLPALLINGDPALLKRLLLELVSNSAKVTPPGGEIVLRLSHPGRQALLTLQDGGQAEDGTRLMNALSGQPESGIPRPDQGAGMGLEVAQRIAQLHRGMLMVSNGPEGHRTVLSLPVEPTQPSISVRTPFVQDNGGLDPLLLGLCDLLPSRVFEAVQIT